MKPKDFNQIYGMTDAAVNAIVEGVEKRLHSGIKKIAKDILNASAEILTVKDGVIDSELADAQALHDVLSNSVDGSMAGIEDSLTAGMSDIDKAVKKEYDKLEIFQDVDAEKYDLDLLKRQAATTLDFVGEEFANNAARLFYDAVLTGMEYSVFMDEFNEILAGASSAYGKPLERYAQTYIRDTNMKYYQDVHNKKAEIAGLDEFVYYGNIMASSRAWCIVRVGQTFTRDTINSWSGDSWRGKSCHPMVCRGGYNCRHHWRPVRKEWIEGGVLNVNSVFEEQPDKMTDNLRSEIKKESKVISPGMFEDLVNRQLI